MKKSTLTNILLTIVLVVGLSLVLYPSFSDYWNSSRQTQIITHYAEAVASLDNEEYDHVLESARQYNATLLDRDIGHVLNEAQQARYDQELNFSGDGIMGYLEIPSIGLSLPVHHGTEEEVLQVAIGHIEWSSLPTGGAGTHCVVSGHRGLPSARLFTDLDQLAVGDYFMLNVLDLLLTYEVDKILIVEPDEIDTLMIEEGKDLCTLVTCTPYGINSHRLLIRGHRVENLEVAQTVRVTADAVVVQKLVVAPFLLVPILLVMLAFLLAPKRKKNRRNVR